MAAKNAGHYVSLLRGSRGNDSVVWAKARTAWLRKGKKGKGKGRGNDSGVMLAWPDDEWRRFFDGNGNKGDGKKGKGKGGGEAPWSEIVHSGETVGKGKGKGGGEAPPLTAIFHSGETVRRLPSKAEMNELIYKYLQLPDPEEGHPSRAPQTKKTKKSMKRAAAYHAAQERRHRIMQRKNVSAAAVPRARLWNSWLHLHLPLLK